jgi:hypothetical protein
MLSFKVNPTNNMNSHITDEIFENEDEPEE